MSCAQKEKVDSLVAAKEGAETKDQRRAYSAQLDEFHQHHTDHTLELTQTLEALTGQESRLTILGHLLRGGTPSALDRVLSTRLGTAAAELVEQGRGGVMAAVRGQQVVPVPLEEVAGVKKLVPHDHPWVRSARLVGTSFGD